MNIQEIIAKMLDGTALTDEEKSFAKAFDLQKHTDTASAAARRKAEGERDTLKTQLAEIQAKLEEAEKGKGKGETELAKLQKQVETLTKAKAESDAKIAAQARKEAIAAAATTAGIKMADGVSAGAFEMLLNAAVGETDVNDAEAMKTVLETFKKDNPAMIADAGKGGVPKIGNPTNGGFSFAGNPWKKGAENLTAQMVLMRDNPAEAKRLAAAEGVQLP